MSSRKTHAGADEDSLFTDDDDSAHAEDPDVLEHLRMMERIRFNTRAVRRATGTAWPGDDDDDSDLATRPRATTAVVQVEDRRFVVHRDGTVGSGSLGSFIGGSQKPGTPYQVVRVPGAAGEVFVHDIVWRAFRGPVPEGFEVRHVSTATDGRGLLSNIPENLVCVPKTETLPASYLELAPGSAW